MDIFQPIQSLSGLVTYGIFRIAPHSYVGEAVNYFIYDTIKIGLLLLVINYLMAVMRFYFPMEKARDILTKRRLYGLDYLLAALLGVVTPFCSCSSIPLFVGFLGAGIPLGVTFTFLISSPLVNESSLYLFPAMFGLKVTFLYNLVGIIVSIIGGYAIEKLGMEKYVKKEWLAYKSKKQDLSNVGQKRRSIINLAEYFWEDGFGITKRVFPYVLLGVGIGAVIHGFVPANLIDKYLSSKEWWTVPAAALLGAPLYANSVGVIPIMEALVKKGVPLGTALAFMTSVVTISFPEFMILKSVMKWQLLAAFVTITLFGVVLIGYIFNVAI